jgi:YD repeat-containing protein
MIGLFWRATSGFLDQSGHGASVLARMIKGVSLFSLLLLLSGPVLAGSVSYVYDNLGRVTQVKYSNGVTIKYTYDAAGNRTSQVVTGAP